MVLYFKLILYGLKKLHTIMYIATDHNGLEVGWIKRLPSSLLSLNRAIWFSICGNRIHNRLLYHVAKIADF